MSYQLIYTSSPNLLDSNTAGYGIVARSEKLPKALCTRISALSVLREPRGGCGITGPQFSYHIVDHAGSAWHVLSCAQQAGADYSGRGCYIAHHLILNPQEIGHLLNSELRPTPAGITLALYKNGFWLNKWQGAPTYITGEPELAPDDVPNAKAQPTWKRITGHKANARAFYTPPFDRDCLVTIAAGTPSSDVLQLFHESDWLTHNRGWGVSYTTEADDADSFAETLRMVTVPASPLVQRAVRTGHPVLQIEQDMEVPLPEPPRIPPASFPVQPESYPQPPGSLMRTLSRSVSHYHYTEIPDWLLYDVDPARPRLVSDALLLLSLSSVLIFGGWYAYHSQVAGPQPHVPAPGTTHVAGMDNLQRFSDLLKAKYEHAATEALITELISSPENTPEDALLLECATILRQARQTEARHAAAIKRLCECSRLLGLRDIELVHLYLNEATHEVNEEEWQKQFDGQQLADWLLLKQSEPQIVDLLQSERLKPFMPTEGNTPEPATILATADAAHPEESPDESSPVSTPGRVSLIPSASVSGLPLPAELEKIIPSLPISISTGSYVVSSFAKGEELKSSRRLNLSPDGYHLYITPTKQAGEFLLKPEHKDGRQVDIPESRFTVRAGRLQQVRSEDSEAVVCFPVPTREDFHTNIVLASSFGIPVPPGNGSHLPPAAKVNLNIQPEDIEIITNSGGSKAPVLRLRKQKGFPWNLRRGDISRTCFSVSLPVLAGHNGMQLTSEKSATFEWKQARFSNETDSRTTLNCELEERPDLPGRLERAFERAANAPCCGEEESKNSAMTLGHLYYICCALANEKLSRNEKRHLQQAYINLFANEQFNKVLRRVLHDDEALRLTPKEAVSRNFKARQLRSNIKEMLEDRNTRDFIRRRICEALTRSMYAAYTEEQKDWEERMKTPPVLILRNISFGSHVELLWQFQLQQNHTKTHGS